MSASATQHIVDVSQPLSLLERLQTQRDRFARAVEDMDQAIAILTQYPGIDLERVARTVLGIGRLPQS